MKNIVLLGSKSQSRQMLLNESKIPFSLIKQDADETKCDWGLPLQQVVENIARYKMECAILPEGNNQDERCFVLTADTLSQNKQGLICGKPANHADAITKIKQAREGMRTGTAFCLDRNVFNGDSWNLEERVECFIDSEYIFDVPDEWIDRYFEYSAGFVSSGAIAIEGYGTQFLKMIQGSYSTIVGLPMFEIRQSLDRLGFFN